MRLLTLSVSLAGILSCSALAGTAISPSDEAPQERPRAERSGRVYKATIEPHWFEDNTGFWYRNDLRGGEREYIFVDVVKGARRRAFDHEVKEIEAAHGDGLVPVKTVPRRSARTGPDTDLTFVNQSEKVVEIFWLDTSGRRQSYGEIAAGKEHIQHTFAGHVWEVVDAEGTLLVAFEADEHSARAVITGDVQTQRRRGNRRFDRRRGREGSQGPRDVSPDGKWKALVRDYNVVLQATDSDAEFVLSQDGTEERAHDRLEWSPDSRTLVSMRIETGERKEVHFVESSPEKGGRAVLHTRSYDLPGDKFTSYEINLFSVESRKQIRPEVEVVDFGRPRLRWIDDGQRFTYEKVDRGHQRYRVIEIDCGTGGARELIDEGTETFIWTAHGPGVPRTTYLEKTAEIIYPSERDGWRHLYLVDATKGEIVHQITQGEWVVRGIDQIDEDKRQIWFHASGMKRGQDPYLIHYYRINFDGTGLTALTEGNGTHSLQYSPDRRHVIDTYSRVDQAPVHELRRVADGRLICALEEADIYELEASGWRPPEVFCAKGRDGETDIWGFICRPPDFDPTKSYPIIESIYAGPHDSHVPKSFSSAPRFRNLTELGFVVVKIDGMGTANRSKAFHDVCWHNLKDAGFPDRILWIKAAAAKDPALDISRVGIYGTSAGGQNAAGAVLFHPEFYKAAMASCGCHDNRMDKASWNEQWMGYPVGEHYAESSNIDNAHRLEGQLLLIVGEMDTNVPPESTLRFVDALVKANKDFDLIVLPSAGHTGGGRYGQRRMEDFFIRYLQGRQPPNRNAPLEGSE